MPVAGVVLRRDDYEDGVLPAVCVRTGVPADVLVDHRSGAGSSPAVLLLLLLGPIGVVLILVVDRLLWVEARGVVPMARAAVEQRRRARRAWNAVALAGLAALAAGVAGIVIAEVTPVWALLAAGGFVVAVVGWWGPVLGAVRGRPDRSGRTVTLSGAHPAFAAAYREQEARRVAARRAEVAPVLASGRPPPRRGWGASPAPGRRGRRPRPRRRGG